MDSRGAQGGNVERMSEPGAVDKPGAGWGNAGGSDGRAFEPSPGRGGGSGVIHRWPWLSTPHREFCTLEGGVIHSQQCTESPPAGSLAAGSTERTGSRGDAAPSLPAHVYHAILGNNHYGRRHLRDALDILARTRHKYPFDKIVSHKFPLDEINEVMAAQDQGHITRASLVP